MEPSNWVCLELWDSIAERDIAWGQDHSGVLPRRRGKHRKPGLLLEQWYPTQRHRRKRIDLSVHPGSRHRSILEDESARWNERLPLENVSDRPDDLIHGATNCKSTAGRHLDRLLRQSLGGFAGGFAAGLRLVSISSMPGLLGTLVRIHIEIVPFLPPPN